MTLCQKCGDANKTIRKVTTLCSKCFFCKVYIMFNFLCLTILLLNLWLQQRRKCLTRVLADKEYDFLNGHCVCWIV